MAEAKADGAPKKKMLMFIIIGVVVLVLLIGGGLAAYFMLRSDPAAEDAGAETHTSTHKKDSKKKDDKKHATVFEKLPMFTVNLNSETGEVMQTEVVIELPDAHIQESVKQVLPKVQANINKLLSSKTPEEVKPPAGRDKLEAEIKEMVNKIIGADGEDGVLSVNFTSYIVR